MHSDSVNLGFGIIWESLTLALEMVVKIYFSLLTAALPPRGFVIFVTDVLCVAVVWEPKLAVSTASLASALSVYSVQSNTVHQPILRPNQEPIIACGWVPQGPSWCCM